MTSTTPTSAAVTVKDGLPSLIAYLTRVLRTPTISRCWEELADQARDQNWSHEEYLAALLQRQVGNDSLRWPRVDEDVGPALGRCEDRLTR